MLAGEAQMERGRFTEGLNTLHFQVVADMEQVRPKYVILPGGGGYGAGEA